MIHIVQAYYIKAYKFNTNLGFNISFRGTQIFAIASLNGFPFNHISHIFRKKAFKEISPYYTMHIYIYAHNLTVN